MNEHYTSGQRSNTSTLADLKTCSVLLVEDDLNFRAIVQLFLKTLGHTVSVAGSGKEALEIAAQNKGVHLLITDFAMPGMNGVELARKIREILPLIKVLTISGFPLKVVTGTGAESDLGHFLQKPFRRAQLDERIKAILAGG